jgi:hypothetical protein
MVNTKSQMTIAEAVKRLQENQGALDMRSTTSDKGGRGKKLELMLGLENTNTLCDLADGEIKSFGVSSPNIAVTMLGHCLDGIVNGTEFEDTPLGKKLEQVLYVPFDKEGRCLGHVVSNKKTHPEHYQQIKDDYNKIAAYVHWCIVMQMPFPALKDVNKLLGLKVLILSGHAGKVKGKYVPQKYKDLELFKYYVGFYVRKKEVMKHF